MMNHQYYVYYNYYLHQLQIYLLNQVQLIDQELIGVHLLLLFHHYITANQKELSYLHMQL